MNLEKVEMYELDTTYYPEGRTYYMDRTFVHKLIPKEDLSVTLITRRMDPEANPDHATVYWEDGTEWGSAEPRPATKEEITKVSQEVLKKYYG